MSFSEAENKYLATQRLGRLATVDAKGQPQNNPVGFFVNPDTGTVDIGGHELGATKKFRNVQRHPAVALVVDDLAPGGAWNARGVEIRGEAEALVDSDPPRPGMSREVIRIRPDRVISWGLD
jgi:pyridoxamine 5'-phosphate oxidase family protein